MFKFNPSNPEFSKMFNMLVDRIAKEVTKEQDRLTEIQMVEAIRQMILSQDFSLIQVNDVPEYREQMIKGGKMFVTITQQVIYVPYREATRLEEELNRYKAIVHDILNEEQREQLAQKLLDQHTQ